MHINFTRLANTFIIHWYQIRAKKIILCLTLLLVAPTLVHAAEKSGMRGQRYCEIIISKAMTQFSVYNTFGLNGCPENNWEKRN